MVKCGTTTGRESGFDMVKLEEAVHYICSSVTADDRLGAVKLNKVLYYADMLHYAEHGESITGAAYAKRALGPVPKQVVPATANLERSQRLSVENVSVFDMVRREFTPHGSTNLSVFSSGEIERLNQMIRFVCGRTAAEISEFSHTIVWGAAEMGEELPYESFLVSYLDVPEENILAEAAITLADVEKKAGKVYA